MIGGTSGTWLLRELRSGRLETNYTILEVFRTRGRLQRLSTIDTDLKKAEKSKGRISNGLKSKSSNFGKVGIKER